MTDYVVKHFNSLVILYFVAHTAIRSIVGGNLERDEAEMILMAGEFHLGYGPQLPLYNWAQTISFALFGTNTFALVIVKSLFLGTFYIALFDGMKRLVPNRIALFGTLGAFLLPNIFWESQRAGTHSIALLATMSVYLNLLARLIDDPRKWHWAALGVAIAAGGLSKYNFWIFSITLGLSALCIRDYRSAIWCRNLFISAAVAAVLLAAPYSWSITHPDLSLAASHKLYSEATSSFAGLYPFLEQSFLALVFPVAILSFKFMTDRPAQKRSYDVEKATRWLFGAGLLGILLCGFLAFLFKTQSFQARWLLPSYVPVSVAMFIWSMEKARPRSETAILLVSAAIAALTLTGMAANRLSGTTGNALDMEHLARIIEQASPAAHDITLLGSNYFYTGNLARIRPHWRVKPPLESAEPNVSGTLVMMNVGNDPEARSLLSSLGISELIERHAIQFHAAGIPYRAPAQPPREVTFATMETTWER
ncbi:glycosyltransferase family 39 protein [Celeribacter indicus]|uniref:Transmembrane protein n=1 Tax=Celeribacter indicus TaxID=1208324 RepID=A0A0B5DR70_9RHOB|nr:glycosyltransferase family 39 protein [Celeribacter indicus]AJE46013.1 transmembrane protein [Celeribacter indicus]SDX32852.1 Dolichyl-phosphate-mannose-protein mannosyltransferase [Celeribacter indicus]